MLTIDERKGMTMQHRFCLKHGLVHLLAIVLAAWSMVIQLFTARPQRALLLLAFCLGTHIALPALAADVQYVYDKLGRLVSVVAVDGNSVQYTYDAVGNIQNIQKNATTALSIAEFSPSGGSAGTTVTIFGSGFDTVAANNIVKFNGKPATVTAATANSLTANAPADVATGKITISNANGLATSNADFVVGIAAAPTITGFTPTMGSSGTVVTISGSNYQLNKTDNKVSFGNSFVPVSSVTSSSLQTSPPASAVSGKISISTPYGQAISSSDFYGLPTGVSSADIGYAGRISVNGPPVNVANGIAGKKMVVLFEGTGQQYLSLMSTGGTFPSSVTAVVYGPDGNSLISDTMSGNSTIDLVKLPISGTYTIVLTPYNEKGSLNLSLVSELAGSLNLNGGPPINMVAGQNGRFTFSADAGQAYGIALTNLVWSGTGNGTKKLTIYLERTDGTAVYNCVFTYDSSCDFYNPKWFLPAGTYVLRFDNNSTYAVSFNPVLSKDIEAGNLVSSAAPLNLTTVLPGQNGRFTFDGVAGQSFNLIASGNSIPSNGSKVYLYIYKPSNSGTEWKSDYWSYGTVNGVTALSNLPETGTYTVYVDPIGLDKGSISLQLQSDATGTLAVDGTTAVSLPIGQYGRYTFTAEAGKTYGLGITNLAFTGTSSNAKSLTVYLEKTDGTAISNWTLTGDNSINFYNPQWFAAAGNYVIRFVQSSPYAVSFNAVLTKDIAAGNLVANASPINLTTTLPGQNGRFTFSATAGQSLNLSISGNTMPITSSKTVWIYKPSDVANAWASYSLGGATALINLTNLPETGTYTILIDPLGLDKGSINLQLLSDATGAMTVDGTTPISLPSGQYGRYTFSAEAGKTYGFAMTNLSFTGTGSSTKNVTMYLEKADGTAIYNCSFSADSSCNFYNPQWFAAGGTYVLRFVQSSTYAVSFNAVLTKDIAAGNLVANASPINLTTTLPGQNGRFTFSATAGQSLNLSISGNTMPITSSKTVWIYKPSDVANAWASYSLGGATALINLTNLPETGTYTILIDPLGLDKGSINLQLLSDATGAMTVDGTTPISLPSGQYGRYTFSAEAGKTYGFAMTNLSFTGTGSSTKNVTMYLEKADGTAIYNCSFSADSSCNFYNPQWFAAGGTYVLRFVQSSTYAVSFNAVLTKDIAAGNLVANASPINLTTTLPGQNGRFTFSATAGQSLNLSISGNTMPITSSKTVWIYKPSDVANAWASYSLGGATALINLTNLPETGTYVVHIDPPGLDKGSINLQLLSDATGAMTVDGTTPISLPSGQYGRYTFSAEAGKTYGFAMTNLSFTGTGSSTKNVTMYLEKADGTAIYNCSFSADSSCNFYNPQWFAAGGTYVLRFVQSSPYAVSFNAVLTKDIAAGNLVANASPINLTTTLPGQNGRFTFSATAGQSLNLSISGNTMPITSSKTVWIYKPSDVANAWASYSLGGATALINLTNLPETGTYVVHIDPPGLDKGSINLQVK